MPLYEHKSLSRLTFLTRRLAAGKLLLTALLAAGALITPAAASTLTASAQSAAKPPLAGLTPLRSASPALTSAPRYGLSHASTLASQPSLSLPFGTNQTWTYLGGPHTNLARKQPTILIWSGCG